MQNLQICQLKQRSAIRIGGADRRAFLQGLISNDIELCTPGKPIYAALLTPQGKFLHDIFILDDGDSFLVDCEADRADDLLKRLTAHKLRAKVTLDKADDYEVWVGWKKENGMPAFAGMTEKVEGDSKKSDRHPRESGDPIWFFDPRTEALGFRAVIKKGTKLEEQAADFSAYDKHRLMLGAPDGSRDMIPEKSTLLECNMDKLNAISWSKGCYMGQELTARMHYRGLVKKRLFSVKIEGPAPAFGSIIQLNGAEVGEMRSSCGDIGLALLSIEKAVSGALLTSGNAALKI